MAFMTAVMVEVYVNVKIK